MMSRPRRETPGDGRTKRQGTSLLNIAGEKTGCNGTLGHLIGKRPAGKRFPAGFLYAGKHAPKEAGDPRLEMHRLLYP